MVTRRPSDREVLRAFAAEVQGELSRLDYIFESDLQEIMQTKGADREFVLKSEMGRLSGAAEWTRLQDSLSMRPQRIRSGAFSNRVPPDVSWRRNGQGGLGALEMATVLGYDSGMKADERPFFLKSSQGW